MLPVEDVVRPSILSGQANGRLAPSLLVTITMPGGGTATFVGPAARAFSAMLADAAEAGFRFVSEGSYRSYDEQVALLRARYTPVAGTADIYWNGTWWHHVSGAVVATPGTSNHGDGLAVDLAMAGGGSLTPAAVAWLSAHAGDYGISAELQSEPWHWRYFAGDRIPAAVLSYEEELMAWMTDDKQKDVFYEFEGLVSMRTTPLDGTWKNDPIKLVQAIRELQTAAAADATRDAAMLAAIQAITAGSGPDAAPIIAAIDRAAEASRTQAAQLLERVAALESELADRDRRLAEAYAQ